MVAIVCLWVVGQLLFLSSFSETRAQELLYREFRVDVASATAPIGPTTPVGDPVALLTHPAARASPRSWSRARPPATRSPAPGTCARPCCPARPAPRSSWAAPRRTARRSATSASCGPATIIDVVMAQGEVHYQVVDVRRAGDPLPQPLAAGGARLTLVTAEGSRPLASLTPGSVRLRRRRRPEGLHPAVRACPRRSQIRSRSCTATTGPFRSWRCTWPCSWRLTLGVVVARQRWSAPLVWIVATPVALPSPGPRPTW